jgi:hypothetical protein
MDTASMRAWGLVQSVFSGLVHHSLALEADKRGHKRQAVGNPVIDFTSSA